MRKKPNPSNKPLIRSNEGHVKAWLKARECKQCEHDKYYHWRLGEEYYACSVLECDCKKFKGDE